MNEEFYKVKPRLWVSPKGVVRILNVDGGTVFVDFQLSEDQKRRMLAVLRGVQASVTGDFD